MPLAPRPFRPSGLPWVPDSPPPSSRARQEHGQGRTDPRGPRRGVRSFYSAQNTLGDNSRANKLKTVALDRTWVTAGESNGRFPFSFTKTPSSDPVWALQGGRSRRRPLQQASAFTNQSALERKEAEPMLSTSGGGGRKWRSNPLLPPPHSRGRAGAAGPAIPASSQGLEATGRETRGHACGSLGGPASARARGFAPGNPFPGGGEDSQKEN